MTDAPTHAPLAPTPRKKRVTLPRLLMLGVAAGAVYGALDYGTDMLVDRTKQFMDEVLIQQAAKNKVVFTYDGIERAGLLQAYVKNPRFVANAQDGTAVLFRTDEAIIYPWGLQTARVKLPKETEISASDGRVILLGNQPITLQVGDVVENVPSDFRIMLPKHSVLRVLDAQNRRKGSYVLDAKDFTFTLKRKGEKYLESSLDTRDVSFGSEEATQPVARYGQLYLAAEVTQQAEALHFDVVQKMKLAKLEMELPESKETPKGSYSMPLDAGWDSKANLELFLTTQEGEQSPPPSMQYLVKTLNIKEGYLNLASMPLLKFSGQVDATREDPQPTGQIAVVLGGFSTIKTLLKAAGPVGETYLTVLDAVQIKLTSFGKKIGDDAIEIILSRKAGEAVAVGGVNYEQALTQLMQAAMSSTGVNTYLDAPGIGKAGIGEHQPGQEPEHPVTLEHAPLSSPIPSADTPKADTKFKD